MNVVTNPIGGSCSPPDRSDAGQDEAAWRHHKARTLSDAGAGPKGIANVVPLFTALVAARPTCGYCRIDVCSRLKATAEALSRY